MRGKLFSNELMLDLSEKYKKTIAQIILDGIYKEG